MKLLVAGATGLLGSSLVPVLKSQGHDVLLHGSSAREGVVAWDLTNAPATQSALNKLNLDAIINLVAATNVDECERNPNLAYALNAKTAENLSKYSKASTWIYHISTDHMYDSEGLNTEDRLVFRNTYALTKLMGELVLDPTRSTVLRTNFFGRSKHTQRKSFSDWIFESLQAAKQINVFGDVYFSALSMKSLSAAVGSILARPIAGVYNLGCRTQISKADFALALAAEWRFSKELLNVVSADSVQLKAIRPKFMGMECSKFMKTFEVQLPDIMTEIKETAHDYV